MKKVLILRTNLPRYSGIYLIQSSINNNGYVGSAVNLRYRRNGHFNHLQKGIHSNQRLQNHYNKYGDGDLLFGIIEIVHHVPGEDILSFKIRLLAREQYWTDALQPELSIRKKADNNLGLKFSEDSKLKCSVSHTKQWQDPDYKNKQKESQAKVDRTGANNPMFGVRRTGKDAPAFGKRWTLSEETKEKHRGKNNKMYGRHPWCYGLTKETNETVKRQSEAIRGENNPRSKKYFQNRCMI
jgi:group I intron endonuclease